MHCVVCDKRISGVFIHCSPLCRIADAERHGIVATDMRAHPSTSLATLDQLDRNLEHRKDLK